MHWTISIKNLVASSSYFSRFGAGAHADGQGRCFYNFDGPHGVLAHAFFPESGRIHFDEAEDFTAHSTSGKHFKFFSIA